MPSSHVAYDRKSGRIVAIHHGAGDPQHAQHLVHKYVKFGTHPRIRRRANLAEGELAVLSVSSDVFKPGKLYKVDVSRSVLVEAEPGGEGVGSSVVSTWRR